MKIVLRDNYRQNEVHARAIAYGVDPIWGRHIVNLCNMNPREPGHYLSLEEDNYATDNPANWETRAGDS